MSTLTGTCHCGLVRVQVHTALEPEAIALRACQCSFCRAHAAKTFSDPAASARVESDRPLIRYRFGKRTADFLLCPGCGVYVAALIEHEGRCLTTVNAVGLQIEPLASRDAAPVVYDDEGAEARRRRREQRWMPTVVVEGSYATS
jgi:hypothetical protein